MTHALKHGFGIKRVYLKTIADMAATAAASSFVDLKNALHATFIIPFGTITAASADQSVTVTVEAATAAASGSEVAVAFSYRKSGAVGTDTWGDTTAATSTGVAVATDDDNKLLVIELDPRALEGALADARFARVVITPDAGGTATNCAVIAELVPRYPQVTHLSAS